MKDLRVIDRDELLATIREAMDRLAEQGTLAAHAGASQQCMNMMYAAGEIDALWEEIRAQTKHSPDPGEEPLPEAMVVVKAVSHELAMGKTLPALVVEAHADYLEAAGLM